MNNQNTQKPLVQIFNKSQTAHPVKLLFISGRNGAQIDFPSHKGEFGTCDFMTPTCAKECLLPKTRPQIEAYKFFCNNDATTIEAELLKQYKNMVVTNIAWFVETGDCPKSMTDKIFNIIRQLSTRGIPQNGFTRNKKLWEKCNHIPNCYICLTIEDRKEAIQLSKYGLVSVPDYKHWTVKILIEDEIVSCGGSGTTCGTGLVDGIYYEHEEDCSICYQESNGCYSQAA